MIFEFRDTVGSKLRTIWNVTRKAINQAVVRLALTQPIRIVRNHVFSNFLTRSSLFISAEHSLQISNLIREASVELLI